MKNNASFVYALFLVVGDFLALLAAFVAAYILRVKLDPRPLIQHVPAFTYLYAFLAILPLWILVHAFIGLYNHEIFEQRFSEFGRLIVGSFIGILIIISYNFVTNGKLLPARLVVVYGFALGLAFLLLFRTIARILRRLLFRYDIGISNLLIIGDNTIAKHLVDSLRDTKSSGYRIVGAVGEPIEGAPHYESFREALNDLTTQQIHSIIQTELYSDPERNSKILSFSQTNHISYRFVPANSDLFYGNLEVELFQANIPIIVVHQTILNGWGRIAKRLFDVAVSLLLLAVLSPLLLLVALLTKLFSPGPVFFRQDRITRFNRIFKVYKFRTVQLVYNNLTPEEAFEKMGKPELSKKYRDNGDHLDNDPRFTGFARFLRKTSLDELPQLLNVVRGDISLVGPRALVPSELNLAEAKHRIVSVKSGITGLAQVSGRRDISYDERRKMDVYYVQNWSFWLDIVILFKTLRAVLNGRGAK